MGSSEWHARVAYRDDIDAALEEARSEAYRSGAFYRSRADEKARSMGEEEYVAWGIEQTTANLPAEMSDAGLTGEETGWNGGPRRSR